MLHKNNNDKGYRVYSVQIESLAGKLLGPQGATAASFSRTLSHVRSSNNNYPPPTAFAPEALTSFPIQSTRGLDLGRICGRGATPAARKRALGASKDSTGRG